MNILLVDDETRFLQTTQKLLVKLGYPTNTASSGVDALSLLETEPIDVVVLDVKMPGMDGITALKEIKRRFPSIEVIMLTGHATIESATEGIQSGAYDYLIKPVAPQDLIKKAQSAYEKKSREKAYSRDSETNPNGFIE